MRTIAIMNNKGGVGKTVTAINLADILVREHGKRVVLADCDGQMHLTRFYEPEYDPAVNMSVADVLCGQSEPFWTDNLWHVADGLDLLPGSDELYDFDLQAISSPSSDRQALRIGRLAEFCQCALADGETDFMVFDCPPGFTVASVAALMAASEVVIPLLLDGFSFWGMQAMQNQIARIRRQNPEIRISGVLITQWRNSEVVREGERLLRQMHVPVYRSVVRRTEKLPESTMELLPVVRYSPTSAASRDYSAWVREFLEGGADCGV